MDSNQPRKSRRLLRSHDDRMLAGVAGGLADYFEIDPIIIRIALGVSVLFGGLGIVAYLALTLFVPADDGSENPQAPAQRSTTMMVLAVALILLVALPAVGGGLLWGEGAAGLLWIALPVAAGLGLWALLRDRADRPPGVAAESGAAPRGPLMTILVVVLALIVFGSLFTGAALLTAVGEGAATAIGLALAGVALVALALAGGGRWLILPVAAIGLGASVAAATEVNLGGGIGERRIEPVMFREIPEEGYRLGLGEMVVDLRQLDWTGRTLELDAGIGVGELVIAVPERVCVIADAHAGVGELRVAGDVAEGIDVELPAPGPSAATPQLRLSSELDVGELIVVNDDTVPVGDGGSPDLGGRDADSEARRRNSEACAA